MKQEIEIKLIQDELGVQLKKNGSDESITQLLQTDVISRMGSDTMRSGPEQTVRIPSISDPDENFFKVKTICKPLDLIFEINH